MHIVVTGASGFIGSHVVRRLLKEGPVSIFVRKTSDLHRLSDVLDQVRVVDEDFTADVVVHLAWEGVAGGERNAAYQEDNVALAKWAYDKAKKAFIGLGSQAEYGPQNQRLTESAPLRPTTAYGRAKVATYRALEKLGDKRFVWLRLFSTYGPGDNPHFLIPYVLRTKRPELTDGKQFWDYLYIDDVAEAIAGCVFNEKAQGAYNLGSGQSIQIKELVKMICDNPQFGKVGYRPDQVTYLEADSTKLMRAIGWRPKVTIFDGLARVMREDRQKRLALSATRTSADSFPTNEMVKCCKTDEDVDKLI